MVRNQDLGVNIKSEIKVFCVSRYKSFVYLGGIEWDFNSEDLDLYFLTKSSFETIQTFCCEFLFFWKAYLDIL